MFVKKYLVSILVRVGFVILNFISNVKFKIYFHYGLSKLKQVGCSVAFNPINSIISYENITMGDFVYIGDNALLMSTKLSHIFIGSKVMFGPNVSCIAGNHSSHIIGKYLYDYKESDKLKKDDSPIFIEDDVWIGAGSIILSGVKIGRGSIIAAGSVINKNVEPYSIIAGVPGRLIRKRWDSLTIIKHEQLLKKS